MLNLENNSSLNLKKNFNFTLHHHKQLYPKNPYLQKGLSVFSQTNNIFIMYKIENNTII